MLHARCGLAVSIGIVDPAAHYRLKALSPSFHDPRKGIPDPEIIGVVFQLVEAS